MSPPLKAITVPWDHRSEPTTQEYRRRFVGIDFTNPQARINPPSGFLEWAESQYIDHHPEHVRPRMDDQMDALNYALNSAPWAEALRGEG